MYCLGGIAAGDGEGSLWFQSVLVPVIAPDALTGRLRLLRIAS